jgi:hypothetical protein
VSSVVNTMPGKKGKSAHLASFLELKDEKGEVVAGWAVDRAPGTGVAFCKHCSCEVNFQQGGRSLIIHSMTTKHKNKSTGEGNVKKQLTIAESISGRAKASREEEQVKLKTKNFEIDLVRALGHHKIANAFLDCLQPILKKHCGDSIVVSKMKLHRSKGDYMAEHGIGKAYKDETVKLLRECDAFSIGFDESEVNKVCQLEILVKLSHKDYGITLRHYRTIDLEQGSAECLTETLLSSFDEDGIDYKRKCIAPMSDGCAVMEGKKTGVKKRLSQRVDDMKDLGACNGHHISNAMQHGATSFDSDIKEVLVDLFQDIGGAKGKGTKHMKEFKKKCHEIGMKPNKIKKYCSTRFRTYRLCLEPVVANWEGLVKYYSEIRKPTERQQRCKEFFVTQETMSSLKVKFLLATTKDLVIGIDFFEKRTELLHKARPGRRWRTCCGHRSSSSMMIRRSSTWTRS